jgi:hypothetical protein
MPLLIMLTIMLLLLLSNHALYAVRDVQNLPPYFELGVDTDASKALRVVDGAIFVAKSAPLGTAVKVCKQHLHYIY